MLKYTSGQRRRAIWILLGLLTLFLVRLSGRHPDSTEMVYGQFLYPAIRSIFRFTTGLLPFPALILVLLIAIAVLYKTAIRAALDKSWTFRSLILGILSTAGALVFLFYTLWGFNYSRPGVLQRIALEAPPLDSVALADEFDFATKDLVFCARSYENEIRNRMTESNIELEIQLATEMAALIESVGYPEVQWPRGRLLAPKGTLLRFRTAGIYIPFSGEGHVDAGLLPVQIPSTLSHELAHGFGVTDEGECNFLAYIACSTSPDPFVRFSAYLGYWRYVAREYRRHFPEDFAHTTDQLPDLVLVALKDIYENGQKYPDLMPKVRNAVYDSYLKSNGVHDGLYSYSRIVRMVFARRTKSGTSGDTRYQLQ